MKTHKIIYGAIMISSLMAWGCNDDDDDNSLKDNDRLFVNAAAQGNMAEIQLGQVAIAKSKTDSVVMFGNMMISDHQTAFDELTTIAKNHNATVVTDMDQAHQQMKATLNNLSDYQFDTTYISGQIKDHQQNIALFQSEINNGSSQDLKDYATKYLPKLQMHLKMADSVKLVLNAKNND